MIRFNNASFHYGGEHGTGEGVDGIDLEIRRGEFVVLCGPSGCGKTTLTRMINGLVPHFYPGSSEGEVTVDGLCVAREPQSAISRIVGSVFQNPKSQFFNIDSTGELAFGCENQNMDRALIRRRLDKTAEDMQLAALMNRNIFELSGGEKQQIAVGSAYTADPEVYVLDEPSSNLDKKAIFRLREILGKIKESGKTIVVSEHRIFYLMELADRFIYLRDGKIEAIWSPDELRSFSESELRRKSLRTPDLGRLRKSEQTQSLSPGSSYAIEAVDLSCARGGNQILDIDRFAIPRGGVVALIGDNGCGKSTLSEALCGVLPCSGSISFSGRYMTGKDRSKKSFMVMQDVNRQLFAESVTEEVRMLSEVSGERAQSVLDALGIGELADRHPASLSGGQKQRVAIATALCAGKEIIFYDEPTSGLDRGGMERFGSLLRWSRDLVTASVIVTHDPELIMECCTHVMHMENGRVQSLYPLDAEGSERLKDFFLSDGKTAVSAKREEIGLFTKVFHYMGEYRKTATAATLFMVLGVAAGIAPYLLAYRMIESVLSKESVTLGSAAANLSLILLCEILYAVFYYSGLALSHRAAFKTLQNLRESLQEKMEKQPLGTVLDRGAGAIKKIFSEDIESIELLLAHILPEGIANLLVPAFTLLVVVAIDWQVAFVTVLMILIGFSTSRQMMIIGIDRMGDYFASAKRLNNTIIEYVNGMEVVRIFNRQGEHGQKYEKAVEDYRGFALAWYRICRPWMALYNAVFAHLMLYSVPTGALLVVLGYLPLAKYVLALCLCFGLGPFLSRCIRFAGALPQVNYKIQAIEKAMDHPPLQIGTEEFTGDSHTIRFENVRFSYRDNEALKGISFTAEAGKTTALVGASGGGKSTVARLIVHYYDASSGAITVGGQPLTRMSLEALNRQISYVSQDLFLFDRSILENIRVGKPDAADEEVREAARKARCEEFLLELKDGYDTMAGTAGARLSGGQRQRIAFARALLKDAPILILDEATAFVDPENEARMREAIEELMRGKTVVAIAHKLRTIRNADKIIVLDDGRILDEGTHDELTARCAVYRRLWEASENAVEWSLTDERRSEA